MEKIYANSEEKYLKGVVLYAIPATGGESIGLFYDAEGTKQAHNSDYDWEDLFLKGLIRVHRIGGSVPSDSRMFYVPYHLVISGELFSLKLDSGDDNHADFFPDSDNYPGEDIKK